MTSGVNSTVGDRLTKAANLLRAVLRFALMLECLVFSWTAVIYEFRWGL